MRPIKLSNNFYIGEGYPCLIIAELSANHGHSIERAKEMIKVAAECGVSGIKLQTYTPDTLTIDCDSEYFQVKHPNWSGYTLYQLYQKAYTPWEWHQVLKEYAEKLGLLFFSTAYDETSVDFLEKLKVPAYKVASFELVDIPLIKYIASKGKPIILSTGMGSLEEIDIAVRTIRAEGNDNIILLKCTSSYPPNAEEMNLNGIRFLSERFNVISGLSEHSIDNDYAVAAVSLGAKVIEKHFTLLRADGGPDALFSLEPKEMERLVLSVRKIEKAIGTSALGPTETEKKTMVFIRKSLFVVKDIKKGDKFSRENVRVIRPAYGLSPKYYFDVIGKRASKDIKRGTPLVSDLIEPLCEMQG